MKRRSSAALSERSALADSARFFWNGTTSAPPGWCSSGSVESDALVFDGLPFPAESMHQVYVGPALGQIDGWHLASVFEEFRRILRQNGMIRIAVWDLDATLAARERGDLGFFWEQGSTIDHAVESQILGYGSARSLFNATRLIEHLEQAGFTSIVEHSPDQTDDPTGRLAEPDSLGDYCCFVEARNLSPWPLASDRHDPSGVHLTLADRHGRRLNIVWSAPARTEGSLRCRPSGTADWMVAPTRTWSTSDGANGHHVFCGRTPELEPGRRYEYEVVQATGASEQRLVGGSFAGPPQPTSSHVRLAFLADTGLAGRGDGLSDGTVKVLEEVARVEPDLILGGGDYAYRSSDDRQLTPQQAVHSWLDQMSPVLSRIPFVAQYGNHEVELGERYREWSTHFPTFDHLVDGSPPSVSCRSYSIDIGPCHVVAFYAPTAAIDPAEVSWLWDDLATARSSGARWVVVFQHQPLVAHGRSHPAERSVGRALAQVLQTNEVDLHLSAHDQNYERTYPVRWRDGEPVAMSTDCSTYRRGQGTVLAKISPAGKRSDRGKDFSRLPDRRNPIVAAASDSGHHFGCIFASDTELVVEARRLRPGLSETELIDRVVITR